MGYAYYIINGRERGYAVTALCDEEICEGKIDHGLAYLCGDSPYGEVDACAGYFCPDHLLMTSRGQRCPKCVKAMECPACEGTGVIADYFDQWDKCKKCKGSGDKTLAQMEESA